MSSRAAVTTTEPNTLNPSISASPSAPTFFQNTQFIPSISLFTPSTFILTTDDYQIPYTEQYVGLPSFSVSMVHALGHVDRFELFGIGRVGFGVRSGNFSVINRSNDSRTTDQLSVIFLPISIAAKVQYEFPGLPAIRPGFLIGLGGEWVHQNGSIDGVNRSFIIPSLMTGLSLSFLDASRGPGDWFGGFTFSTTYQQSLGNQQLRGWGFDLGLNIFL